MHILPFNRADSDYTKEISLGAAWFLNDRRSALIGCVHNLIFCSGQSRAQQDLKLAEATSGDHRGGDPCRSLVAVTPGLQFLKTTEEDPGIHRGVGRMPGFS